MPTSTSGPTPCARSLCARRRARRLLLDQRVSALGARVALHISLPRPQLCRIEQRQLRHALGVIRTDALQQVAPMPADALDRGHIEQRGGIGERRNQPTLVLGRVEDQVELGAVQQGLEGGQQQHEQGHPLLARQGLESLRQGGIDIDAQTCALEALHRRPRAVDRQLQQRLLARQLLAPAQALVQADQLVHQDRRGPAIGNDMVHGQDQHMLFRPQHQQPDPQQRTMLQEPLALLCIGKRCPVRRVPSEDRGDPVEVDTLALEQGCQCLALPGGQRLYGVEQLLHFELRRFKASKDLVSSSWALATCPDLRSTTWLKSASVACSNSSLRLRSTPSCSRTRPITWTISSECPPRSPPACAPAP
ncbi:hypothetical protein WR25_25630 [Diploscapter pachys]|uniref:Uncharacterized protein n=1 Tax=Diploscapter pachys TaxID=2018661 RepID=A0A2A2K6N0_9BILA|nr:hypothetical protein WR25_25630 [Diploscapter pachys]